MSAPPKKRPTVAGRGAIQQSNGEAIGRENATSPAAAKQYRADSYRAEVLQALLAGESLTHADALRRFGCARLAAVVCILRHHGSYPVKAQTITVSTAHGKKARVASYSMGGRS